MEENIEKWETVAIVVMSVITAKLGVLFVPLVLLVVFNIADYVTGMMVAPFRGQQRSSNKGFLGIAKKISMWILVGVGVGVDLLLGSLSQLIGMEWPFSLMVGCLVCIWLLANEMISLIENISDLGVDIPPFLIPMVRWVKRSAEDKAKQLDTKKNLEENRKEDTGTEEEIE